MLTDILNESQRKIVYVVFAIIGVVLGATQVAFSTMEVANPVWLSVAIAVYAFLGGPVGATAASNIFKPANGKHEAGE